MYHLYVFQNESLDLSVTWNKTNRTSNYTLIKHMLPMSSKFRVKSYIKTILSKTQENSGLKTTYLKRITTEELFIIFILRDYLHIPYLFIYLLKSN